MAAACARSTASIYDDGDVDIAKIKKVLALQHTQSLLLWLLGKLTTTRASMQCLSCAQGLHKPISSLLTIKDMAIRATCVANYVEHVVLLVTGPQGVIPFFAVCKD
jgi:hypothetical protein